MRKSDCLAYLRTVARGNKGDSTLNVLPASWQPFTEVEGTSMDREILLLNAVVLGRGNSGIVFGALYSTGWESEDRTERLYIPVALKVAILLRGHIMETVNAHAMRELTEAGCTPGLAAYIDSFCLTGALDEFNMPPKEWIAFWNAIDIFVYAHREEISSNYGKHSIEGVFENTVPPTARVRRGYTMGFSFYELSPYGLTTSIDHAAPRVRPLLKSLPDPKFSVTTLGEIYVMTQALASINASNAIHGDLHGGNFVKSPPLDKRYDNFDIAPHSMNSNIARRDIYGSARCISTASANFYYAFQQQPISSPWSPLDGRIGLRDMAVVVRNKMVPLVIDVGNLYMAQVYYDENLAQARNILFEQAKAHFKNVAISLARIPLHGASQLPWSYYTSRLLGGQDRCGYSMAHLRDPTTQIDARAPEQLNPFIGSTAQEPLLVISSELSDVFSLATTLVGKVIGFSPIARRLPMLTTVDEGANPSLRNLYRAGVAVRTPESIGLRSTQTRSKEYCIWSPYNSLVIESYPELSASSEDGHDPRSSPTQFLEQRSKDARHKYYYEDYDGAIWAAYVKPFESPSSSTGPSRMAPERPHLYDVVANYLKRELEKRFPPGTYCTWYGYRASAPAPQDEFNLCVLSLVARIEALGIPSPDQCRGTLLYDLFREIERLYGVESRASGARSGWLPTVLYTALIQQFQLSPMEASDICNLLLDALAWDPARRPPAERILQSTAFRALYEPYSKISLNPEDFWGAWMPSSQFWPLKENKEGVKAPSEITWPTNFSSYYGQAPEQRTLQGDACVAARRMARCQEFVSQHGAYLGFLTRISVHRVTPLIHQDDTYLMAIRNFNAGLLDYESGLPCMVYEHGLPSLFHAPNVFGHFKEPAAITAYLTRMTVISTKMRINLPRWIFIEEREFEALTPAQHSPNLKRSYETFVNDGGRIEDLVPASRLYPAPQPSSSSYHHKRDEHLPPPEKRQRTDSHPLPPPRPLSRRDHDDVSRPRDYRSSSSYSSRDDRRSHPQGHDERRSTPYRRYHSSSSTSHRSSTSGRSASRGDDRPSTSRPSESKR